MDVSSGDDEQDEKHVSDVSLQSVRLAETDLRLDSRDCSPGSEMTHSTV